MKTTRATRYQQLSEGQITHLRDPDNQIGVSARLHSFTGAPENLQHFQKALQSFEQLVHGWPTQEAWLGAFVSRCCSEGINSKRAYETICSQFKNGFAKYLQQRNLTQLPLREYSSTLINEFYNWLKGDLSKRRGAKPGNATPRSEGSCRKYFQTLRLLLEALRLDPAFGAELPEIIFPRVAFSGSHASASTISLLDDISYKELYKACRKLAMKTLLKLDVSREIIESSERGGNALWRRRGQYSDLRALLYELQRRYPATIPALSVIRRDDPAMAGAIQRIHGGYREIQEYFQPSAETIMPFILLLAIYTSANTGPLRSLRWENVRVIEGIGSYRIQLQFEKGRGGYSYRRTFAVDEGDRLSPGEICRSMEWWTKRIRAVAEPEARANVFLFVSQQGRVRSFLSAVDYGSDSDSSWKNELIKLSNDIKVPLISLRQLRFVGLDLVRDITNDDLRAVKAAGGQSAESTIRLHYEGAATFRRRHEELAQVMQTQARWVTTKGRVDPRGGPDGADVAAATPGWNCIDPYHSPIPGESDGRLCEAFGSCPACPHATISTTSPYSLARVLQLQEEVRRAVGYLDRQRWTACYEKVAVALREKWIPAFNRPEVWHAASQLNVGEMGRLE